MSESKRYGQEFWPVACITCNCESVLVDMKRLEEWREDETRDRTRIYQCEGCYGDRSDEVTEEEMRA